MRDSFVLFVDDSRLCALVTSEILRDNGFDVLETGSAEEAYAVIGGTQSLLALVTDIELGGGDNGFDIARRARALRPGLPVVYVSGVAPSRHAAEGVIGSEFIAKPFRRQRIVEALGRVIGARDVRSGADEVVEDRRAVAEFLGLVAGGDVVARRDAPVAGATGRPVKEAARQHPLKGPVGIAHHVGGEP
jgi:DNA-binding NtrC family response regulator